jgi:competence protein ComEA
MPNPIATTRLCGGAAIFLASFLLLPGPARADDFPEGQGKDALMKVCTSCHGLESIPHLKYSKKEWQALVYQMQDNGANATGEELDTIVNYLATNFGNGAADDKINVNTATAGDIEQGLGLSTKEAAAIVQYRTKNGNFKTLDDLKKVDGVDAKKLDAAKDRVAF